MPIAGAIGSILKRSHSTLALLIDKSIEDVRRKVLIQRKTFALSSFIEEAAIAARLNTNLRGCNLEVSHVDPLLKINANRELLHAALVNLLQNAFKFTHEKTTVALKVNTFEKFVFIDVADHCGGLLPDNLVNMFTPFKQQDKNRSGLGLGLTIARQSVEADSGTLTVCNVSGTGCVFTIKLPLVT